MTLPKPLGGAKEIQKLNRHKPAQSPDLQLDPTDPVHPVGDGRCVVLGGRGDEVEGSPPRGGANRRTLRLSPAAPGKSKDQRMPSGRVTAHPVLRDLPVKPARQRAVQNRQE